MLDQLLETVIKETVKQTIEQLGVLENSKHDVPEILSTQQLADYLGMSVQWVYEHTKELPHEKRGRKTLFVKSEIDDWRQQQREENKKQKTIKISSSKSQRGLYKIV